MTKKVFGNVSNAYHLKHQYFMKSNLCPNGRTMLFALLFLTFFSSQTLRAQQFLTSIDGWNAYVHLPDEYNDSVSKRYPVIIFLPGIGELGTDASRLLINGPSKFIAAGHNMQFTVNGKVEKPIVISLQPRDAWGPGAAVLNRRVDSILARWRCDVKRIHGTGLSLGASTWGTYVSAGQPEMTSRLASMVVMAGGVPVTGVSSFRDYSIAGGKWWGFEGTSDPLNLDQMRDTANYYKFGSARYYRYAGGHCCWNNWYNPSWNENGESIYTWMLKQVKPAANNLTPESFAGRDSVLATVVPSFNLRGNGNDPDGNPISFNWRKISGPASGTFANATAAQTMVSALSMGVYHFELTVTDALGAVATDTVIINDGAAAVLPLTLLDFKASEKRDHILLQWTTTSETNTSHFEIEKLGTSQVYEKAGALNAKGSFANLNQYQYSDHFATAGVNYYRLKMIDKDGQFTYSKVIAVNVKNTNAGSIAVLSVRAQGEVMNYFIKSSGVKPATILLADMQGRVLYSKSVVLSTGINALNHNVSLQKAAYVLKVITKEVSLSQAFIKE